MDGYMLIIKAKYGDKIETNVACFDSMDKVTETIEKIEGYGVNAEYHFCSIESDKVSSVVKAVCHICD